MLQKRCVPSGIQKCSVIDALDSFVNYSCEIAIYLMRSTISAIIATPIQSAMLAKKTPPTPIWQRYCI